MRVVVCAGGMGPNTGLPDLKNPRGALLLPTDARQRFAGVRLDNEAFNPSKIRRRIWHRSINQASQASLILTPPRRNLFTHR
jgi:hypothetical protein